MAGMHPAREQAGGPVMWPDEQDLYANAVVSALGIEEGSRILEVGCGRGVALPAFAGLCKPSRLVGLDIDADLIGEAAVRLAQRGVDAELVIGDVTDLPFEDNSFDVVVDFGLCDSLNAPEPAIVEIARVTAPGGVCIHERALDDDIAREIAHEEAEMMPWPSVLAPESMGRLLN